MIVLSSCKRHNVKFTRAKRPIRPGHISRFLQHKVTRSNAGHCSLEGIHVHRSIPAIVYRQYVSTFIPCYSKYSQSGKPLYIRRYHTQSSHCALRSYSYPNFVSGDISSLFQVLFKPCQSQIFPSTLILRSKSWQHK